MQLVDRYSFFFDGWLVDIRLFERSGHDVSPRQTPGVSCFFLFQWGCMFMIHILKFISIGETTSWYIETRIEIIVHCNVSLVSFVPLVIISHG